MNQLQTELMRETISRKMKAQGIDIDLSKVTFEPAPGSPEMCPDCDYDIIVILKNDLGNVE